MAKYDVHAGSGAGAPLLLECQSDLLNDLNTRFVVPLLDVQAPATAVQSLYPVFDVEGVRMTMATHLASAVPVRELGPVICSLAHEDYAIGRALDVLIGGV